MGSQVKIADLEALLRSKHLDRTLTSTRVDRPDESVVPVGIPAIDCRLRGGFPRGHLSELVGTRSAGRTTAVHALVASATARGELVALVDSLDTFDPASAAEAGVDLGRLLWVRGPSVTHDTLCRAEGDRFQWACDRALKAFNLILQTGAGASRTPFCVVLDLVDIPISVLRRIPFVTWLRLQRVIEGREGTGLILADTMLGRSAGGITLQFAPTPPTASPAQISPWQRPQLIFQLSAVSSQPRLVLRT